MESAESTIALSVNSSFKFTELVAAVTDNITQIIGFTEEDAHWISLSVRESVINAMKHGNKLDRDKQVEVNFIVSEISITIYVRDYGQGFNLEAVPDPLDPTNLLNPNGRGIFYMRTFMDEVAFSIHPQGGTVVKMFKRKNNQTIDTE